LLCFGNTNGYWKYTSKIVKMLNFGKIQKLAARIGTQNSLITHGKATCYICQTLHRIKIQQSDFKIKMAFKQNPNFAQKNYHSTIKTIEDNFFFFLRKKNMERRY
jgi:predicted ATPase